MPYGKDEMAPMAVDLCKRGFAIWNIEYRRVGEPDGGWPGTLDDVAAALDFLKICSSTHEPLNLNQVAVIGHSAGGHLALACTSLQRRTRLERRDGAGVRPRAVVGLAALTDLHEAFVTNAGDGAVQALLGGSPAERPDRYADASPVRLLPHGAKQLLLLHGLSDDNVPIAQSRRYAQGASLAGDYIEYIELENVDHMEFLNPQSPAHATLCAWLDKLFATPSTIAG